MSRGVLINTLDTYIGTALYEEFLGENPAESAYELYGTWHSKDDSSKPAFIKKMLKRSKPVLFRKYMREKMDCYVFDLHSGRLDDLKWAVWALTNEPLDSEKTLIVISSVLSWGGNEPKMVEVKPKKKKPIEEGEEPPQEGEEKEEEEKEEEEKEDEEKKEEEEKKDGEEKKQEEAEPQFDENGNPIEPPKQEFDEYGNEILAAKLDEQGNEILPPNDDDFEYYFEEDYKEKKRIELEEQKKKEQEELNKLKEENPDAYKSMEEEKKKEEEKKEENKEEDEKKEEDEEEKQDEENPEGEEGEEKKRVYKRIIKVKIIKPKIFKRVGYREKDYKQRIPIEFYKRFKEYEDYLLDLKFENLNIYIICAGIPYGGCETTFNYFFKSAWLQNPIELPYYNEGNNLIPTIHIKDLARIVRRIADNKAEFPYIFAFDRTKDSSLKNIISSISKNIGSGKTVSIPYNKNLIRNISLKEEDFFIDKLKYEKNKLVMNITKHELMWTRFLGIDVMLKKSKYLGEDYEWYCKEGIPANCPKLLKEFCSYRYLRPLKIILNCKNENYRKLFAEKISKFYNIPILNFELMMEKLNQNISDNEEEKFMNEKYYKLKERLDFLEANPDFKNEANELLFNKTEILYECLKYLLKSNAAVNRGYVLEGIPVNMDEINSIYYYKKEMKPNPDEEEEKPPEEEEIEEEEEEKKDEEKKQEEKKEEEEENKDEQDEDKKEGEEDEKKDEEDENKENEENKEEEKKEEENNEEGQEGEGKKKKKKKKKKKIKPKKYKTKFEKTLLPESIITLTKIDKKTSDVDNTFWEVEQFYQDNKIEIMNLVYEEEEKDDPEELFEMMRIYIERNGRPFNYFKLKDEDINMNRINYVDNKKTGIDERKKKEEEEKQRKIDEEENLYWKKMEERIENIKKDKSQLEENQKVPTRKFLLVNIMPTLTKGLLEVCKINPIDPIDYLADFLFTNSTGEK
jgi:adenylate kinase